jgi:PAS domain S-box-containing protein
LLALPDEAMQVGTRIAELAAAAPDLAHVATERGVAPVRERRLTDGTVVEIRVDPLPDGGFVVTATDVTARVRAAEAIRDSERRIRVYTDNVPVLISYIDGEQRYRFVNAPYQAALGLPERDIDGRHLIEVLGAERYGRLQPYIDRVLAGEPQVFEIEFPTNDAKIEVARGTYLPHVDDAGAVIGFFVLYQDMTERRHAEAALRQAAETLERRVAHRTAELEASRAEAEAANLGKTRFIAAASHDLLQPLHAARLFTAALAERHPGDELVGKIDQGLASVEALLDALLDISRLDSGALAPDRQPVPVAGLIEQLAATFAPVAARRGAELTVVPTSAVVTTDPALLRRVLQNLISNALRYGGRPGVSPRVLIGCRRAGETLRIEVWDNGPGIPEDKREAVFEEFTRLAGPFGDPAQGRGLGLGLAIVERIARVLDHPLSLRSEVGHGSVFAITVPLAKTLPLRVPVPSIEPASPAAATLVLCIDDEAPVREAMATLLQSWGCQALIAADAAEARQVMAASPRAPDLVIADLHLGSGPDGLSLIDQLRRDRGGYIAAAVVTADRGPEVRARARERNVDVLLKPVRPAALRALIAQRSPRRPATAAE